MAASTEGLAGYLEEGERVLWSGRPPRGIMFRFADVVAVPVGFVYFGSVLYLEARFLGAFDKGQSFFFSLWGLPFVAVGFYFAIGRFPWDALVRGSTFYALTNRRAIISRRWPSIRFRSVPLTCATEVSTDQGLQDTGTIYFGPRVTMNNLPYRRSWRDDDPEFKFEYIAGLDEALRVVGSIQREA